LMIAWILLRCGRKSWSLSFPCVKTTDLSSMSSTFCCLSLAAELFFFFSNYAEVFSLHNTCGHFLVSMFLSLSLEVYILICVKLCARFIGLRFAWCLRILQLVYWHSILTKNDNSKLNFIHHLQSYKPYQLICIMRMWYIFRQMFFIITLPHIHTSREGYTAQSLRNLIGLWIRLCNTLTLPRRRWVDNIKIDLREVG
jgi:hypothetical protein